MSEDKSHPFTYEYIEPAELSKTPGYWPIKLLSKEGLRKLYGFEAVSKKHKERVTRSVLRGIV